MSEDVIYAASSLICQKHALSWIQNAPRLDHISYEHIYTRPCFCTVWLQIDTKVDYGPVDVKFDVQTRKWVKIKKQTSCSPNSG